MITRFERQKENMGNGKEVVLKPFHFAITTTTTTLLN